LKSLLQGSKLSSRHQTVIDVAKPLLRELKDLSEVTKIVIGPVKQLGKQSAGVKVKAIRSGLELSIKGGGQLQVIYVYGEQSIISKKVSYFQSQEVRGNSPGKKKKCFQPRTGAADHRVYRKTIGKGRSASRPNKKYLSKTSSSTTIGDVFGEVLGKCKAKSESD
jgi:hypothetical protein